MSTPKLSPHQAIMLCELTYWSQQPNVLRPALMCRGAGQHRTARALARRGLVHYAPSGRVWLKVRAS